MKACGSRGADVGGANATGGAAAARGCAVGGVCGCGAVAGGGAKPGAEPLMPLNPTWAKASVEAKAKSAKAQNRAARMGDIDAVSPSLLGRLQGRWRAP